MNLVCINKFFYCSVSKGLVGQGQEVMARYGLHEKIQKR